MSTDTISVGLVACGKSKLSDAAPARALYTGSLFRAAAEYAQSTYDFWYVISAKHYLLHPDDVIEPYDRSLRDLGPGDTQHWAIMVDSSLRGGRLPQTGGRSNCEEKGPHLGQWIRAGGAVDLYLHAGRDYAQPLLDWGGLRGVDRWATVHTPMAGLQIGEHLHWYAKRRATVDVEAAS